MCVCVVLWCRSKGKVCGICMVLSSTCVCVFLWCRSEGKACGICMEQVTAKLTMTERRFGIMCENCSYMFHVQMH